MNAMLKKLHGKYRKKQLKIGMKQIQIQVEIHDGIPGPEAYNVSFSKGEFANTWLGMRDMILGSNTFEKNSARRTF